MWAFHFLVIFTKCFLYSKNVRPLYWWCSVWKTYLGRYLLIRTYEHQIPRVKKKLSVKKLDLKLGLKIFNTQRYCDDMLRPVVVPFMRRNNDFVFQKTNARPHIARLSMNVLQANNVNTLPWPSRSPDLAPIENIWELDKQTNSRESSSIQLFAWFGKCAHHWMERHSTAQDKKKSSEACKKDVELPLLPTGPGQDTDIVDLCVNSSCVTYCKSGSLWITIFCTFMFLFIVVIIC